MPSRPSEVRKAPPPARSGQNTKEKFCFPFRKNPARAKSEIQRKLFCWAASVSERWWGDSFSGFENRCELGKIETPNDDSISFLAE